MDEKSLFYGRELTVDELPINALDQIERLKMLNSYDRDRAGQIICRRCGQKMTQIPSKYCKCKKPCGYCRACIQMGKVRMCEPLYYLPEPNDFQLEDAEHCVWSGELSKQQQEASEDIIKTIKTKGKRLIWAVTGAGKTEMIFPGINLALKNHFRICIASPRVDVILELAPRIQAAFPKISLAVLHGKMDTPYQYTPLVLASTHQLLRFKAAFDLLIVDEIDAFPFRGNAQLKFAVQKAIKPEGTLIFLSATPDQSMRKEVESGKLDASILPARYHRHALPEPHVHYLFNCQIRLLRSSYQMGPHLILKKWLRSGLKFLVFVPSVHWLQSFQRVLEKQYADYLYETVHATDPMRHEKVSKFREGAYDFLVTSTILERGVTFSNVQVMVIGADSSIFTSAALLQIAGRVGRSPNYPTGEVYFYHGGLTSEIKDAVRQIKTMNQLSRKRGLVD